MIPRIEFARPLRLIRQISAKSIATTRDVATRGVRQKKIQRLRTFIKSLPETLPFSGPDLVMGCACGYQIDAVRPFVESLFDAGRFRGEAVMFVKAEDKALSTYLEGVGVKVFLLGIQHDYPIRATSRARHFAYFKYLQDAVQSGRNYRNILLTDVRDVIFQRPLFATTSPELELHYESRSSLIGACEFNSQLIRGQFGQKALTHFADKPISCAGTVCGRTRGVLVYLAEMQIILLNLLPRIRWANGDQGVHNYVLHSGLLPQAKVLENFERVATLHHVHGEQLHIDPVGRVVNPDGSISEIVHQYDRHPHLTSAIQNSVRARAN